MPRTPRPPQPQPRPETEAAAAAGLREAPTGMEKAVWRDDICSSPTMEITAMTAVVANSLKLTEVPAKRWPAIK